MNQPEESEGSMSYRRGHVYLIGIMGCGKSSVGRHLAQQLGYPFVDLDRWIVLREGRSVNEIFETDGEERWRALERKWLDRLSRRRGPMVIATGGGIVVQPENIRRMRRTGIVVWLDRPVAEIASNIDIRKRPLLKDGSGKLQAIYEYREPLYRKASHIRFVNQYSHARRASEQLCKLIKHRIEFKERENKFRKKVSKKGRAPSLQTNERKKTKPAENRI